QYEMGKLKKSESNNKGVEATTFYSYNEAGLPSLIQSTPGNGAEFIISLNYQLPAAINK
ncbi:MAG: hypothetical protein FYV88_3020, partial [Bacteroidetes bacterium]|nr:hypothetical protein [Bacteroidota bacterium]